MVKGNVPGFVIPAMPLSKGDHIKNILSSKPPQNKMDMFTERKLILWSNGEWHWNEEALRFYRRETLAIIWKEING